MASLLYLPQEISAIIINQVHPRDWLSLKQTCKELRTKTAHLVADFFFRKRVVMLERRSLQCLVSIARDQSLGQSIEELDICTSHLLPLEEMEEIEPPNCEYDGMIKHLRRKNDIDAFVSLGITDHEEWIRRWPINNGEGGFSDEDEQDDHNGQDNQGMDPNISDNGNATRSRLERINTEEYSRCLDEQEDMVRTGYDMKCLVGAMMHLKRCRTIRISTSIHAWGLSRLRQRIGILPQRGLTFESKASIRRVYHIVQVVLAAIASSGMISVVSLEINAGVMLENANRISPCMLMGPPSSSILSGARSFPASLRQLQISLDPTECPPPDDAMSGRKWGPDFIRFIHLLPELSDLDLGFENRDEAGRFSSEIAKELYIPKLESITLHMIDTTKEDLAIFLQRHHRTLRTVVLDSIQLEGDLTACHWLIEIVWRSLDLDELSILSSWAAKRDEDFSYIEFEDINIWDEDSYIVYHQGQAV